jgi:ParB family chromosome partitioning protein
VARRGGLGKGLGALIPPGGTEGAVTEVAGLDELPLASISPNRFQPRGHFDEEALSQLADSIREVGVLQPVLVRPAGEGRYELIAGGSCIRRSVLLTVTRLRPTRAATSSWVRPKSSMSC